MLGPVLGFEPEKESLKPKALNLKSEELCTFSCSSYNVDLSSPVCFDITSEGSFEIYLFLLKVLGSLTFIFVL